MTILSAFGGGLWIIPIILFLAAVWSTIRGIRFSQSGAQDGGPKIPFYKIGAGVFAIVLWLALIGVIILMLNDR